MNLARAGTGIAALALLAGCGTASSGHPSVHQTSCAKAGSVQPATPVVQIRTTSQGLHAIRQVTTVGCRDWVRVLGRTAAANVMFTPKVRCQLSPLGGQPSSMQIRNPASVLFTLEPGHVDCVFGRPQEIPLCGMGTVFPGGGSSGLAECGDPLFAVAVYSGTMRVEAPGSQACLVTASHLLSYDFAAGKPALAAANFSPAEIRLFRSQADELGVALARSSVAVQSRCTHG
jgi:hypothetical protein